MPEDTTTTGTVVVNGVNNDDPNDDGRYHGQIDEPGDRDWVRMWLESGTTYQVDMLGADNPWTEEENSWPLTLSGPQIAGIFREDREPGGPYPRGLPGPDGESTYDLYAAGPQSTALFRADVTGWHYVKVQSQSTTGTGTYAVQVWDLSDHRGAPAPALASALLVAEPGALGDDCATDPATECSVSAGGSARGEIEEADDRDWFSVAVAADRTYQIDVKGLSATDGGGTLANAGLLIREADGEALDRTSTTQGGASNNARHILRRGTHATLYLEVRGEDGGAGSYTVAVTDVTDRSVPEPLGQDFDNDPLNTTPGRVLVGGSVTGRLSDITDADRFLVTLEGEKTYRLDLRGADGGFDALPDPALRLRSTSTATPEVDNDNVSSTDANARIVHTVPAGEGGVFAIIALTKVAGSGSYTLSVTDTGQETTEPPDRPQNLAAAVNGDGSVTLSWEDPGDASITGHRILRRNRATDEAGVFTAINEDTGSPAASYVDRDVAADTRYAYRIEARNAAGLSLTSASARVNTPAENSPATGAPVITGTVQVGETLGADTSGIADADGLGSAVFAYQWMISLGAAGADIPGATEAAYTPVDADEGVALKVRVSFTDDAGNAETLTSAATAAVAGLAPEPLTAGFENTPSSHDGENVFTFELRFSEQFRLNYRTLRDHAFTVADGAVSKARRMEQGSNIHWRITVKPNSGSDVSIVLPVTSDCEDQGAICAKDGRMLSSRLELTVSGPGG